MIREFVIKSFCEYIQTLQIIKNENDGYKLWFRGQSDYNWGLVPGIFREAYSVENKFGDRINPPQRTNLYSNNKDLVKMPNMWTMVEEFKDLAKDKDFMVKSANEIQLLELAQHYGVPTLLLDWTTDPLVALFFAIANIDLNNTNTLDEKSAATWIINPIKINQTVFNDYNHCQLYNSGDNCEEILDEIKLNIGTFCFEGTKSHPRICRQSGNFTFTGSGLTFPLDFLSACQSYIYKIEIPYSIVNELKDIITLFDLSSESVYFGTSDLDIISAKVKEKIYNRFHKSLFK